MSDAGQYINTYLEHAMGMLHENLNNEIRMRTELKIANDLLVSRDGIIRELQEQLNALGSEKANIENSVAKNHEEINKARGDAQALEQEVNAMRNKVAILDGLHQQYADLKSKYLSKEAELESKQNLVNELEAKNSTLETQLKELKKSVKSVPTPIVTAKTKKSTINNKQVVTDPTDDF